MSENENLLKPLFNFYNSSLSDQFKRLTLPMEQYYGFDLVTHRWISPKGECFDMANKPSMQESYFTNHFYKIDPLSLHPDNYNNGAFLSSAMNDDNNKFLKIAKQNFDLNFSETVIICKKREDGVHFFILATTNLKLPVAGIAINNLNVFDRFCEYLLSEWEREIKKMDPYIINMASLIGEDVFNKKRDLPFATEIERKREFLKSIGVYDKQAFEFLNLTKREKECLSLIVKGLSVIQMAKALHISPHTVKVHIKHIKERLDCSSRLDILDKINYLKLLGLY